MGKMSEFRRELLIRERPADCSGSTWHIRQI